MHCISCVATHLLLSFQDCVPQLFCACCMIHIKQYTIFLSVCVVWLVLQAWMLFVELGRAGRMSKFHMGEAVYPYTLLCPFVLSAAVSIALTALVGWHAFLIWQGQVMLPEAPAGHITACFASLQGVTTCSTTTQGTFTCFTSFRGMTAYFVS